MKTSVIALVAALALPLSLSAAFAQDKPGAAPPASPGASAPVAPPTAGGKPDCTAQKTAHDEAKTAAKEAGKVKPDLSSCADKKGAEKKDCETPLKDQQKANVKAAKDKVAEAKKALDCCKKPTSKACAPAAAPATP